MIMSHYWFMWWCTVCVGGLSVGWLVYDSILLRRHLARGRDARDQIFGSIVGITIAVLGIIGVLWVHLGGIPEPTHCLPQCRGLFFTPP